MIGLALAAALLAATPTRASVEEVVAAERAGFAENAIQFAAPMGLLDEAFRVADACYLGRGFRVGPTRFTSQQGGYTPADRRVTHILFAPTSTRPDKAAGMGLRL